MTFRDDLHAERRRAMVDEHLARRDIRSPAVLRAMGAVRRERFVPAGLRRLAYSDAPLAIGEEQTISQPYMVALMVQAAELEGGERVLEIGAGSGYGAAVLAEIAAEVYTIDRNERLAERARRRLAAEGYANVRVCVGDGTLGWPEAAPFDAIVVTACGPSAPPSLLAQLAPGGRLIVPVGGASSSQRLLRVRRTAADHFQQEGLGAVAFVPLIGAEGWPGDTR